MKRRGSGERRPRNPELQLQRRLATYRPEYWDILAAAAKGESYQHEFAGWHQAASFRSRFYKFRMDAIEGHVPNALRLREVEVTGEDGLGARFNPNIEGIGPYKMLWRYIGTEGPSRVESPRPAALEKGEPFVPGLDEVVQREMEPAGNATEQLMEDWLKQGVAPVAESTPTECEHEWDVTETRCLKCGAPWTEQGK